MKEINYLQILQTLACQSLATLNRPQLTGNTEKNKKKNKKKKQKNKKKEEEEEKEKRKKKQGIGQVPNKLKYHKS